MGAKLLVSHRDPRAQGLQSPAAFPGTSAGSRGSQIHSYQVLKKPSGTGQSINEYKADTITIRTMTTKTTVSTSLTFNCQLHLMTRNMWQTQNEGHFTKSYNEGLLKTTKIRKRRNESQVRRDESNITNKCDATVLDSGEIWCCKGKLAKSG